MFKLNKSGLVVIRRIIPVWYVKIQLVDKIFIYFLRLFFFICAVVWI